MVIDRWTLRTFSILALTSCLACAGDDDPRMDTGVTIGTSISTTISTSISTSGEETGDEDSTSDTNTSNTSDTNTSDTNTSSNDTGIKLDISNDTGATAEGGQIDGCEKVDLLFVIDNSGSMADEQASLIASFSGFVDGIQAELATADSYHIGVVTTDAYSNNAPGCTSIGALVTQTGGDGSAGMDCLPFSSGKRYLDDTEPDLDAKFSCIAQVGISGSGDEIQAQAGTTAVSLSMNQPGACNDGFIRPDALLVVVFITDEDDAPDCIPFFGCLGGSAGNPPDWAAQFVQAKNGIMENIVMLALVGQSANNTCGADHCQRMIALTNWFFNGSSGDICAPSYEGFFTDAISVIDGACDNFTPPE